MFALNLDTNKRILSVTEDEYAPESQPRVEELPEGNVYDYKYIDSEYVYDPITLPEIPTAIDIRQLRADIDFIAMVEDINLDDQDNMVNNHSPKFELVRKYYREGLWSERRVRLAVEYGWITQEECDEILSENF